MWFMERSAWKKLNTIKNSQNNLFNSSTWCSNYFTIERYARCVTNVSRRYKVVRSRHGPYLPYLDTCGWNIQCTEPHFLHPRCPVCGFLSYFLTLCHWQKLFHIHGRENCSCQILKWICEVIHIVFTLNMKAIKNRPWTNSPVHLIEQISLQQLVQNIAVEARNGTFCGGSQFWVAVKPQPINNNFLVWWELSITTDSDCQWW